MSLLDRPFIQQSEFDNELAGTPLGIFAAFVVDNDPHSPVALPYYDQLVTYLEDQVPLY